VDGEELAEGRLLVVDGPEDDLGLPRRPAWCVAAEGARA
jgi:hypothetical protein